MNPDYDDDEEEKREHLLSQTLYYRSISYTLFHLVLAESL